MSDSTNGYLKPLQRTNLEITARILFYFIIVITFMVFLQLVIIENLSGIDNTQITVNLVRATTGIVGIGITFVFLNYDKKTWKWIRFSWTQNSARWILLAIPLTIIGVIITILIEYFFRIIPHQFVLLDIPEILVTSFFTVLGIGVGEEIIYRGYVQTLMEERYSFIRATMVSSFLFGLNHFFLGAFLSNPNLIYMTTWSFTAIIFGASMSYLVKLTNNLTLPICIHAYWDIVYFILKIDNFQYDTLDNMLIGLLAQLIGSLIIVILSYLIYSKTNIFTTNSEQI